MNTIYAHLYNVCIAHLLRFKFFISPTRLIKSDLKLFLNFLSDERIRSAEMKVRKKILKKTRNVLSHFGLYFSGRRVNKKK